MNGRQKVITQLDPRQWPYSAVGNGVADDTTAITNALAAAIAAGVPLDGDGKTYGVTGQITLAAGARLRDITFKQLAPGSLTAITLASNNVNNLELIRVKVNRNGDGTNGGTLNGAGANGALGTAYGVKIVGGAGHYIEDLEVYGDDSGTGILFQSLDISSRIIRPHVHDIEWKRIAAADDQVQGIWLDQCSDLVLESPRVVNLTGVLNGTPTHRFTRCIPLGGCKRVRVENHYVDTADQGIDITGGPALNEDIRVVNGISKNIYIWGHKIANTGKRCVFDNCIAYRCGVGFVASGNRNLSDTTDRNLFVDCVAIDSGYTGQTVVAVAGFRVLFALDVVIDPTGEHGSGARTAFRRCRAIDLQVSPTMSYGFSSEVTNPLYAPTLEDCESIRHTTAATSGLFLRAPGIVGTVSQNSGYATGSIIERGTNSNGTYTKFADGTMICAHTIDCTSIAWTSLNDGLRFPTSANIWTFPMAFALEPVVSASVKINEGIASGVNQRAASASSATLLPWVSAPQAVDVPKYINAMAVGRWF
jgi:hypothetical protein